MNDSANEQKNIRTVFSGSCVTSTGFPTMSSTAPAGWSWLSNRTDGQNPSFLTGMGLRRQDRQAVGKLAGNSPTTKGTLATEVSPCVKREQTQSAIPEILQAEPADLGAASDHPGRATRATRATLSRMSAGLSFVSPCSEPPNLRWSLRPPTQVHKVARVGFKNTRCKAHRYRELVFLFRTFRTVSPMPAIATGWAAYPRHMGAPEMRPPQSHIGRAVPPP